MATTDPIPFRITKEILSRLPLKTLLRFRLACKQWESIICDRKFRRVSVPRLLFTVCNRVNPSLSFFASPPTTEVDGPSFSLEAHGKLVLPDDFCFTYLQHLYSRQGEVAVPASLPIQFPVVESVHGLIIVENEQSVVIYNPSTRESKRLPESDLHLVQEGREAYGRTVLHYDPLSDEYICLRFHRHPDKHFDGRCIGLEDSEWKSLARPPSRSDRIPWYGFDPSSAYLGGALYLASPCGELLRFHPSSRTYEEVHTPDELVGTRVLMYVLFIFHGKLAITSCRMRITNDWCLYTLDDELGFTWTRVNFVTGPKTRKTLENCEKRGITDGGEIILVDRYLRMRNHIYYYDPLNGNLRVSVAEVTGLAEDNFKTQFGGERPRALLHTNHVEHLMFLGNGP